MEPVTSIREFKEKYGEGGTTLALTIEEFIRRAPDFPGGRELVQLLGEGMADLSSALRSHKE